jgi:hypothetical protein
VLSNFGAATVGKTWRLGLYSQGGGYPSCVTFFEGRLFWGGCPLTPTRVDGSMSSNYETFSAVLDRRRGRRRQRGRLSAGFRRRQQRALDEGRREGAAGRHQGRRMGGARNSLNAALTPTNVKATRATTYGSYELSQPVRTGKDVIFVQRKRKKVRNLNYAYDVDGFNAGDLTVLAGHIGKLRLRPARLSVRARGLGLDDPRRRADAGADL